MILAFLLGEWKNFLERIEFRPKNKDVLMNDDRRVFEICTWASYRGQTLNRTGKLNGSHQFFHY
jgi:hypothetical protein